MKNLIEMIKEEFSSEQAAIDFLVKKKIILLPTECHKCGHTVKKREDPSYHGGMLFVCGKKGCRTKTGALTNSFLIPRKFDVIILCS